METSKLLSIAKEILDLNENASLTGTLMLHLRGIDLGREIKDIDILIPDYAPNAIMPEHSTLELSEKASDGSGVKYLYKGVMVDILSSNEEPVIFKGVKMGTIDGLMQAKYEYSKQENNHASKHHEDLIKMGFKFPEN